MELGRLLGDHAPRLARTLVRHVLAPAERDLVALDRRLRAARAWVDAVLAGRTDDETLEMAAGVWLPELAGHDGAAPVEVLRDLADGLLATAPGRLTATLDAVLARHAAALHACSEQGAE